jgi:primosomal replication protein N
MATVPALYVGALAANPERDYGLDGIPVARFTLRCAGDTDDETRIDETRIPVRAAAGLADLVLRDLRRGDRVLVVGSLAAAPPDAARRGAADLCLHADRIGLDLTATGWRRDPPPATGSIVEPAADAPAGGAHHW